MERTRTRLSGQADFGLATERRFTRVARALRRTVFAGVEYLVIESTTTFEGQNPGPYMSRQYVRQDDAALYSFPDFGGLSAYGVASPGTPAPARSETVLLVYPVHVGSAWSATPTYPGNDPKQSTFTVEAIEPVRTSIGVEPAARVRAHSAVMLGGHQPDLTWFGRSGVLRTWKRTTSPYITPLGEHGERERTTEERMVAVTGL